jgi:maleylpyruvate isomerase
VSRPDEELLLAYRGTAAFLRQLSRLVEAGLDQGDDPLAVLSRRRTIAAVGYSARAYADFAAALREGEPLPLATLVAERGEQAELGASLPARALQHLAEHSAVHLRVEWRDLPDELFERPVIDAAGAATTARQTVARRASEVWAAAVTLGARRLDVPSLDVN